MESDPARFERELAWRLRDELDALRVTPPSAAVAQYRLRPIKLVPALAMAVGAALVLGTVAAVASSTPYVGELVHAAAQSLGVPSHRPDTTNVGHPSPTASPQPTERAEPSGSPENEAPGGGGGGGRESESPDPSSGQQSPGAHGTPEPDDGAGGSSPGD